MKIKPKDIELVITCGCCPFQVEAFYNNEQVGYLRLRHGYFRVEYPDSGGETIYEAEPDGDGRFTIAEEEFYLNKAKEVIIQKLESLENEN